MMGNVRALEVNDFPDLLLIAQQNFDRLAKPAATSKLGTTKILAAIALSMDEVERANYAAIVTAFVETDNSKLSSLFDKYGARSELSHLEEYHLFGQVESILVLERLRNRKHKFVDTWRRSNLPEIYLEGLASAAGVHLPTVL